MGTLALADAPARRPDRWVVPSWPRTPDLTVDRASKAPIDRLAKVWSDQQAFMRLLRLRRDFPAFPVDLHTKEGQRLVKEIAYDACHELHEAVDHLKNAKLHRATEVPELDRAAFLEELVDAFKFIIEVAVLSGVTLPEFWAAYEKKTERNTRRIAEEGY
jgi:hypothetical protein